MELKIQILTLLLISFLHLYQCQRCRQEEILVYDCTHLSLTDLPSEKLGQVFKLDLSHNEITTLKNDAFLDRDLIDIGILYLQDNKITTIEVHAFRGMQNLDFLNLNNNDIIDVPKDLFKSNMRLRFLRFENNTRLKLPQEGFSLPELSILDLERCGLKMIPPNFFDNMRDLEIIYLRGNKLSYVDPGLIRPLNELEFLDLRENMFTKLQVEILRMPLIFKVSFIGNPLNCDCALLKAYSLYKKKAPFEELSCTTFNGTLKNDLTKLATLLDCNPTTILPSTQFSNVSVAEIPNENNSPYLENGETQDLDSRYVNTSYNLAEPEKGQRLSESSLTAAQLGIVIMSGILLTIFVIISIIILYRKRVNSFFITNRFSILREEEGETSSFDPISDI